jgi:hypothetical protein
MSYDSLTLASSTRPLSFWPAVVIMDLIILARYVPGFIEGASSEYWYIPVFIPMLGTLLMLIWWVAGSRATGREKWMGFVGFLLAVGLITLLSHASMRGVLTNYLTLPLAGLGFGIGALLNCKKQPKARLSGVLLCSLLAMSVTLFLRSEGIKGDYAFDLRARWAAPAGLESTPDAKPTAPKDAELGAKIEAAVAMAVLVGAQPVGLLCEIVNEDGSMSRMPDLEKFAAEHSLPIISIESLAEYARSKNLAAFKPVVPELVWANLPLESGAWKISSFTNSAGIDHAIVALGDISNGSEVLMQANAMAGSGKLMVGPMTSVNVPPCTNSRIIHNCSLKRNVST